MRDGSIVTVSFLVARLTRRKVCGDEAKASVVELQTDGHCAFVS
jgi:hypothetical protein